MRRLLGFLACLLPACASTPVDSPPAPAQAPYAAADREPAPQPPQPELHLPQRELHLIVLHSNDVHGQVLPRAGTWIDREHPPQVGGLPRIAGYVNAVRDEAQRTGAGLLVVDAGDWFQGTPEGQIERGAAFLEAFAMVGWDAVAVGNHELDHGIDVLRALLEQVDLPAVCANVEQNDARIDRIEPWIVVERCGLRIALVGLLSVDTPTITHPDASRWTFEDPAQALTEVRAELAGQVDWILPLTHLGLGADRELARAHPDLDLIVGGHSHTYLEEGVLEGQTHIVQTGSKASAIGRVDLWLDPTTKKVARLEARTIDLVDEIPETWRDAELEDRCARLVERSAASMDEVLGELAGPLERAKRPCASSSAGNLIADLFRERAQANVGLMNRGGIRADLPAGPVTRRMAFEILPFDNHLVTVDLSGAELVELLRRAVESESRSGLEVSGLVVRVEVGDKERRLAGVRVGGAELDPAARYSVVLNSFMAGGGDGFLDPTAGGERREDPILMRELFELALRERGRFEPDPTQRYENVPR